MKIDSLYKSISEMSYDEGILLINDVRKRRRTHKPQTSRKKLSIKSSVTKKEVKAKDALKYMTKDDAKALLKYIENIV